MSFDHTPPFYSSPLPTPLPVDGDDDDVVAAALQYSQSVTH